LLEQGLALRRGLGDAWQIARSLRNLGEVARCEGDLERAAALCDESLARYREWGDRLGEALGLRTLARTVEDRGDRPAAAALFARSLAGLRDAGARGEVPGCLLGLARLAAAEGRLERAARLAGAAQALLEATGGSLPAADRAAVDRHLAAVRPALGEPAFGAAQALGRRLSLEAAVADALADALRPRRYLTHSRW
jgi:ATP/maltotriose-dependent transcriptional regulator MalT